MSIRLRHWLCIARVVALLACSQATFAVVQSAESLLQGAEVKINGTRVFRSDPPGLTSGFYKIASAYELQKGVGNVYLFKHDLFVPYDEEEYWYLNDLRRDKPKPKQVVFERLAGTETYLKQFGRSGDFEYQLIKMIDDRPAFITLQCDKIDALDAKALAGITGLRNTGGPFPICKVENREGLMNLVRYLDSLPNESLLKAGSVSYLWPVTAFEVFNGKLDESSDPGLQQAEADRRKTCEDAGSRGRLSRLYKALNCHR